MDEAKTILQPGDRVRITEDIGSLFLDRPDQTFLDGTKGSVGVIVSYEEFRKYSEPRLRQHGGSISEGQEKFLLGVKQTMEEGFRYPIRFEKIEPSANSEAVICCQVGEISLIHAIHYSIRGETRILEKVS